MAKAGAPFTRVTMAVATSLAVDVAVKGTATCPIATVPASGSESSSNTFAAFTPSLS